MKAKMLLDSGKPKVEPQVLKEMLEKAGFEVGDHKPDLGVVVGGDGRFSRYGRTEDVPLLFVGVRSKRATGSKAYMAHASLDQLPRVLEMVREGHYRIERHKRLDVLMNGEHLGRVFTDVYLQRGAESTCIRYNVRVRGEGIKIDEAGIGDGVVVTTSAGSSGYYSYIDRVNGEAMDPTARAQIAKGRIGVCHIAPTYTEREGTGQHPLRYTVPWGAVVELTLFRKADARLYGTSDIKGGVRVGVRDEVQVRPSNSTTKIIVPERRT